MSSDIGVHLRLWAPEFQFPSPASKLSMEGTPMLRPAALLAFAAVCALGQSFEAASIKPFPPDALLNMSGCIGGPGGGDPARITCEHTNLKMLLMRAYQVK